jgi:hypothetical protein
MLAPGSPSRTAVHYAGVLDNPELFASTKNRDRLVATGKER